MEPSRSLPAEVRNGNFARMMLPVFCDSRGSLNDLALGSRRKPGHVSSVGMPQSSKILDDLAGAQNKCCCTNLRELLYFILAL